MWKEGTEFPGSFNDGLRVHRGVSAFVISARWKRLVSWGGSGKRLLPHLGRDQLQSGEERTLMPHGFRVL